MAAAGDAVTGALLARAVERGHGGAGDGAGQCLNCGTALIGRHCHSCGQGAQPHKTLGAIWHDLAHGVFHFEGKAFRTLPMLVFRPGQLTRRYIDGERTRFVSPLALFLFSVFLMFAVVANLPGWNMGGGNFLKPGIGEGVAEARTKMAEQDARAAVDLAELRERLKAEQADAAPSQDRIGRLQKRIADLEETRVGLQSAMAVMSAKLPTVSASTPGEADNWLERKIEEARANPKLLLYKLKTSAYKFSWALIPISLPFIWLLFPLRRDVGFYDHAIFATYSLTFMSLLTILLSLLNAVGVSASWLLLAALVIPPFHMYRQLKGTYGLGRLGALWRLFWLLNFATVTTTLFVLLLLYLGIAD